MKIGNSQILQGSSPFIIAEMSGNHNQSLERALEIVDAAALSGVNALKIQTYTADTMTIDAPGKEFFMGSGSSLWGGSSLYELYKKAYTPWEWHKEIFSRASQKGLIPFSTPFDQSSVDFLEDLGAMCYKIASFENNDLPLIRYIAKTNKPIIMSTGMASLAELSEAVNEIRKFSSNDIALLKCTSTYPALPINSNIATLPHLKALFGCEVGLSDHTLGIGVSIAAIALGASVIEKHFTLNRLDGGVDSQFSMEPSEMTELVIEANRAWQSIGKVFYGPTDAELESLKYRRSLYVIKDMIAGEIFTQENVMSIRPGLGLAPKYLSIVLGRCAKRKIFRGEPITWDVV